MTPADGRKRRLEISRRGITSHYGVESFHAPWWVIILIGVVMILLRRFGVF